MLESGRTYEYEGASTPSGLLGFIQNKAYRASANVYDLAKRKFIDIKRGVKEEAKEQAQQAWSLWERARDIIARFLSLREDGYIAKYSDKLFRLLGFGALNYYLKMLGFFVIVIAPFILVIVSVLFPTPP